MSQTCCELKLQFASETWLENLITFSFWSFLSVQYSPPFFPFLDLSDQIPLWYYSPSHIWVWLQLRKLWRMYVGSQKKYHKFNFYVLEMNEYIDGM